VFFGGHNHISCFIPNYSICVVYCDMHKQADLSFSCGMRMGKVLRGPNQREHEPIVTN
jgi:hypothetical protein